MRPCRLSGCIEAVRFLLKRGARPDVAPMQNNLTSLRWAALLGFADMAKLLLDAGAGVEAHGPHLCTPMLPAVQGGHRDVMDLLWRKKPGLDLEWRGKSGTTALDMTKLPDAPLPQVLDVRKGGCPATVCADRPG